MENIKHIHQLCKELSEEIDIISIEFDKHEQQTKFLFKDLESYLKETEGLNITVIYKPGMYQLSAIKDDIRYVVYLNKYEFQEYEKGLN